MRCLTLLLLVVCLAIPSSFSLAQGSEQIYLIGNQGYTEGSLLYGPFTFSASIANGRDINIIATSSTNPTPLFSTRYVATTLAAHVAGSSNLPDNAIAFVLLLEFPQPLQDESCLFFTEFGTESLFNLGCWDSITQIEFDDRGRVNDQRTIIVRAHYVLGISLECQFSYGSDAFDSDCPQNWPPVDATEALNDITERLGLNDRIRNFGRGLRDWWNNR